MIYNPPLFDLINRMFPEFVEPGTTFALTGPELTEPWDHLVLAFLTYSRQEISQNRMVQFTVRQMRQKKGELRISVTQDDWNAKACIDLLTGITAAPALPTTEGEQLYRKHLTPYENVYDCSTVVGVGWYALLFSLGSICSEDGTTFRDVKEKYGELSLFPNANSQRTEYACDFAEYLSGFLCEHCGQAGHRRDGGWVRTLCDQHDQ